MNRNPLFAVAVLAFLSGTANGADLAPTTLPSQIKGEFLGDAVAKQRAEMPRGKSDWPEFKVEIEPATGIGAVTMYGRMIDRCRAGSIPVRASMTTLGVLKLEDTVTATDNLTCTLKADIDLLKGSGRYVLGYEKEKPDGTGRPGEIRKITYQ